MSRTTEKSVIYTTEYANVLKEEELSKNWYLNGGTLMPKKTHGPLRLFPEQSNSDRITEQLMYIPEDYEGNS